MRPAVLVLLFIIGLTCYGQERSFINYGLEDGLAQSQVNMVHQDSRGYLWIATIGGLSRFDGHEFENYYKSDGLDDNDVSVIYECNDSTLVFGCLGGLSLYDEKGFRPFSLPGDLVKYNITALDEYEDGVLWVGTNGGGLLTFDMELGEFSDPIRELGKNIRWFERETGLVATDRGLFKDGLLLDSIFHNINVTDVEMVGDDLWVSTLREGLFIFDGEWRRISSGQEDWLYSVRQMNLMQDGSLWCATRYGALCFHDGEWTRFFEDNGLPYQNIRHVTQDKEGNIWLSTNGQGVYRYVGDLFTTYTAGSPLLSDAMLSMTELNESSLYLGMFNEGLQLLQGGRAAKKITTIPSTDVWAMVKDSKERIWAGTSAGLYMSKGDGFMEVYRDELPSTRITSLKEDHNGRIWIGHRSGVSVVDDEKLVPNPLPSSSQGPTRVRAMAFLDEGVFLGAENGLFELRNSELHRYTEDNGLTDNSVYSLSFLDDRLWVGTKTGLQTMDINGRLTSIVLTLENNPQSINFLHISDAEQLYVGTNRGLFRARIEDGPPYRFMNYGITDGLPSLETNLNAVYQLKNGDVYFGTNKGIVQFDENRMLSLGKSVPPFLHIGEIRLWEDELDLVDKEFSLLDEEGLPQGLILQNNENHLTFEFVGIRLSHPESVKYQYRLDGADQEWSPITESNMVTYSALGSGDYTFQVRVASEDGEDSHLPQEFRFTILAPMYLRPWALIIQFLLLGIMVYGLLVWQRRENDQKRERVELGYRNRMYALEQQSLNSSMNRHFIFNALNAIQFYINKEEKREANRYLTSFAKLIRKNLDTSSDLWVTLKDELERLELYLDLEKMRFSDRFDYRIEIRDNIDVEMLKIPAMILQPYLENSIWHGILPKEDKGEVIMTVKREGDGLSIVIDDDGIGVEKSLSRKLGSVDAHESKGLKITDDRIQLFSKMTGKTFGIEGPYDIVSDGLVKGTRTELFIPDM